MWFLDWFKSKPKRKTRSRRYDAAKSGNHIFGWMTSNRTSDSMLRTDLRKIRERSRDLCINNDYVRKFIKETKKNVVGHKGIALQSNVVSSSGESDDRANEFIEQSWREFSKLGIPTVDGRLSWIDAQNLIIESIARDGEIVIRHFDNFSGNRFGYAFQLIEADQLDEDSDHLQTQGVVMGIEKNRFGRPLAYHLLENHPGDDVQLATRRVDRVSAEKIIHAFMLERPTQSRGVPWVATGTIGLKLLDTYRDNELVASGVAASKMGFLIPGEYSQDYKGDAEENGVQISNATPGHMEELPRGYDFKSFDPTHPSTAYSEFSKEILRGIAGGLDINYNTLANDLEGVNFSSLRQGALSERDGWRCLQRFMIEHICQPIFERWLSNFENQNDFILPSRKASLAMNPIWQPRGWAWVDPKNEAIATESDLTNDLASHSSLLAERGVDFEDIIKQKARDKKIAEKHGVKLNEVSKTNEQTNEDDTDESAVS